MPVLLIEDHLYSSSMNCPTQSKTTDCTNPLFQHYVFKTSVCEGKRDDTVLCDQLAPSDN